MGVIEGFAKRASQNPRRVVFPEGSDDRIVQAAFRLAREGIARPVLLADPGDVSRIAGGPCPPGLTVLAPSESPDVPRYASLYARRRQGVGEGAATRLVNRPLYFGGMMVREGDADALVAGAVRTTAQVITAGALTVGYADGVDQPSSFFIMVLPGPPERLLVFADAAVAVDPAPQHLAQIARVTAVNTRRLLQQEPRVALLSFSTHGSSQHPLAGRVREATQRVREGDPSLVVDGEIQADAALSPRVANLKCPQSPLAGNANVLIFPNLEAGNIAYKLTQYLAGARAIGPVLQGFAKPVCDLSRGATVEDIVAVATIACLQVGGI